MKLATIQLTVSPTSRIKITAAPMTVISSPTSLSSSSYVTYDSWGGGGKEKSEWKLKLNFKGNELNFKGSERKLKKRMGEKKAHC